MTCLRERKWVRYSADQMLDLVADVENYPQFLPWCVGTRILSRERWNGVEKLVADLIVAFKSFRESFTSQVNIDRAGRHIEIEYLKGPFKNLENRWRFEQNSDGTCTIDFLIDFEFKSKALKLLIGSVMEHAFRKMIKAFVDRADVLYSEAVHL